MKTKLKLTYANRLHTNRLLKLSAFLYTMPQEKFDFGVVMQVGAKTPLEALKAGNHRCGTVACAMGWAPAVFPRVLKWLRKRNSSIEIAFRTAKLKDNNNRERYSFRVAAQFFGLSSDEALYLFNPGGSCWGRSNDLDSDSTAKEVAAHIRRFVKERAKEAA